jgi:hypothetical protein
VRLLDRLLGRPDPHAVIEAQDRTIAAYMTYCESLRLALLDERRRHSRTMRLLEEATAALLSTPDGAS